MLKEDSSAEDTLLVILSLLLVWGRGTRLCPFFSSSSNGLVAAATRLHKVEGAVIKPLDPRKRENP